MSIRLKAAGVAAAVIAAVGLATVASASSETGSHASSGSGSPMPPPKPVKASAPQARTPVFGDPVSAPPGAHAVALAYCPAGTAPTGGGGASGYDIYFTDSYAYGNGWVIRGANTTNEAHDLRAFVLCQ